WAGDEYWILMLHDDVLCFTYIRTLVWLLKLY
ncbi:MAG: hypothetical protein ACI9S7_000493, partial [Candidatus Paceibacteria bacterium]